jgi:hypothetical protein
MARQPPERKAGKQEPQPRERRRFEVAPPKIPKHPYRDSAVFHGALAGLLVFVAWLTGGGIARALVVGLIYFVAATTWAWWRFRRRIEREAAAAAAAEAAPKTTNQTAEDRAGDR